MGVTRQPFPKEMMHMTYRSNQLPREKHCRLVQKRTKMRGNEGRLSDHWVSLAQRVWNLPAMWEIQI